MAAGAGMAGAGAALAPCQAVGLSAPAADSEYLYSHGSSPPVPCRRELGSGYVWCCL